MSYKTYTASDLADFTGRPQASFKMPYTEKSAIPQALLLWKMATCLASPDDLSEDEQQMVDFAVLSMADAICLAAPYAAAKANPFNSESIGSYSYSKAASAVNQGLPTGIGWFDEGVMKLGVCDQHDGISMTGGIEVFENTGGYFAPGHIQANRQFLTPADVEWSRQFGFDPAPGVVYVHEGD